MKNKDNKGKVKNIINKIFIVLDYLYKDYFVIAFLIIGLILPLLFKFSTSTLDIKIMSLLGTLFSTIFIIYLFIKYNKLENKKNFKKINYFTIILYVISVISYFDFNIFGIKSILLGILVFTYLFYVVYNCVKRLLDKSLLSEDIMLIIFSLSITFLYLSVFLHSVDEKISKICFIVFAGSMYLVIISLVIIKYLFSEIKRSIVKTTVEIIFWCSIVIFTFPYFIKWCGVKNDDFEIFLNTYTAFIGGGITLIGVGWTIKKSNDDLKRERRAAVKPLIYPLSRFSDYDIIGLVNICFKKEGFTKKSSFIGVIKNTDNGILIIKEALINGELFKMKFPVVLEKNGIGHILVFGNPEIEIQKMIMICKDVLGNDIKYEIIVNEKRDIEAFIEI